MDIITTIDTTILDGVTSSGNYTTVTIGDSDLYLSQIDNNITYLNNQINLGLNFIVGIIVLIMSIMIYKFFSHIF